MCTFALVLLFLYQSHPRLKWQGLYGWIWSAMRACRGLLLLKRSGPQSLRVNCSSCDCLGLETMRPCRVFGQSQSCIAFFGLPSHPGADPTFFEAFPFAHDVCITACPAAPYSEKPHVMMLLVFAYTAVCKTSNVYFVACLLFFKLLQCFWMFLLFYIKRRDILLSSFNF